MLTEKDYCDYDTCVALKELGFRERCVAYYDTADNVGLLYNTQYTCDVIPCQYCDLLESRNTATEYEVDVPTLYEAQKWLREEKGMLIQPTYLELSDEWICVIRDKNKRHGYSAQKQKNYEEALLEGIKEAIKILKEK